MDYLQDPNTQYWLTFLISHILLAFPLMRMAARTKEEPAWFAWVPILNGVLALHVARRPLWWIILFFVPVVNLVMVILLTMALCERFGVNKWWGLIGFLTPLNIILIYYLAYGTKTAAAPQVVKKAEGALPDTQPPSQAPPEQGQEKKDE